VLHIELADALADNERISFYLKNTHGVYPQELSDNEAKLDALAEQACEDFNLDFEWSFNPAQNAKTALRLLSEKVSTSAEEKTS